MSADIAVGIWLGVLLGLIFLICLIFLIGGDLDE